MTTAVVTGAAGFIGGHLVHYLKERDYHVVGVDVKEPEFGTPPWNEFHLLDLAIDHNCWGLFDDADEVYHLAADMGGIGYITQFHASILHNNLHIDTNVFAECAGAVVPRVFYSSSACVYPTHLQDAPTAVPLKEEDAWPARPEEGYGLEKLVAEKLLSYYAAEAGLQARIARFHNCYGSHGAWDGGREKAPAAICRKVASAKDGGEIEIWGDGEQSRSFMHVRDCVAGIYRLMQSDYSEPLNLGTDRAVTINQLVDIVCAAAGKKLTKIHIAGPQGVRGRNSDNSRLRAVLDWEPQVSLEDGLRETYAWIAEQVASR